MKFRELFDKITKIEEKQGSLEESLGLTGKKEAAKAGSNDLHSKDAARKRVERSHQIPRAKRSPQELVKECIIVKTKKGRTQIIFRDSFDPNYHTKLSKNQLTLGEAQRVTKNADFEQTRASKLLFGNVKEKPHSSRSPKGGQSSSGKTASTQKAHTGRQGGSGKPKIGRGGSAKSGPVGRPKATASAGGAGPSMRPKAQKMSQSQMFGAMQELTPDQLLGVPQDVRNAYFQMFRKPPSNIDFDKITFETLSAAYNIPEVSSTPYNQQVINAVMFLAKMKAGASTQEIQTYSMLVPGATDFTRNSFFASRKILSQIGDMCIQTMFSAAETGGKPINSEGAVDMACGEYRFKVQAGGELAMITNQYDQSNKNFRGLLRMILTQILSNPAVLMADEETAKTYQKMAQGKAAFADTLVPDELISQIEADEALKARLQQTPVKSSEGTDLGFLITPEGTLNPAASLNAYTKAWEQGAKELMRFSKTKTPFKSIVINGLLKTVLRGDNIRKPVDAPTHLMTVNGIFPLTDEYFKVISTQASLDIKKAQDVMTSSNITNYKPSAAEVMTKFTTVIEEAQPKKVSIESSFVKKNSIEPIALMVNFLVKNHDFTLNASLLPGFDTKDLNSVAFNYVAIGGKSFKIPVTKDENIASEITETTIFLNDVLLEALSCNFVLSHLVSNHILTELEADLMEHSQILLNESSDAFMINFQSIFKNAMERVQMDPERIRGFISDSILKDCKICS